jgi:Protein of unknown function (DUF2637)
VKAERALRLAEASIIAGTGLGFALSYSALRRLANEHGYTAWEAATWPLAVDFVAVACTALAMALARRPSGPTGETWAVAGAAALISLSGNVVSAWGDPIAMAMHAWAAAVYIALWHTYWRASSEGRGERADTASVALASLVPSTAPQPERSGHPGAARQEPAPLGPPTDTTPAWPPVAPASAERARVERRAERPAPRRRRSATGDPRTRVRALVQAADAGGERLTGADVARAIGRSPQRGRALLAEVRADLPVGNGVHR